MRFPTPEPRRKYLAIIPARGGSKRVPGKNLRLFQGISLLQHAINHAKGSHHLNSPDGEILVSSDCEKILNSVPPGITLHHRPEYLASDNSSSEACIASVLFSYSPEFLPTYTVLIQPTSPLRTSADIDSCLAMLHRSDCLISASNEGRRNGAIYAFRSTAFLERLTFPPHFPYVMWQSLDIDTEADFKTP